MKHQLERDKARVAWLTDGLHEIVGGGVQTKLRRGILIVTDALIVQGSSSVSFLQSLLRLPLPLWSSQCPYSQQHVSMRIEIGGMTHHTVE
jgi:hypothetical protein